MEIKCPKCKKRYEVEDAAPGQEIQSICPRCSTVFNYVVPAQAMAAIVPTVTAAPVPTQTSQPDVPQTELIKTHPCPQCGCQVNDGASYCPGCGTYQFAGPDPKAQPQQTIPPQVVYVQQPSDRGNKGMFRRPFSFFGRIRRLEYGLSYIIVLVAFLILEVIVESEPDSAVFVLLCYIPIYWFLWAQGAKRCHDLGNSGWWQIIPFYFLWMLFAPGDEEDNGYGENPKN